MKECPHPLSIVTMIGDEVVNREEEQLDTIRESMIDMDGSQMNHAVMSFGNFPGPGGSLFTIPWKALSLNQEQVDDQTCIPNIDKDHVENESGFDKDCQPDEAHYATSWLMDLYKYHGYPPPPLDRLTEIEMAS